MVCHVEKGENHMKIHSLKLKNFRGYKDELFISFGDLTAFVGRNDVGKSTILEALDIFLMMEKEVLVMPVEPTWEQKLAQWDGETYQGKEFYEGTAVIITEKGERVRSKSEKILADYFYRNNIIYKYEKPLFLKGYGTVYPDFTFLSRKTGEEIYWEHEGMMDKSDYAKTAVKKLESYQKNGIYLGERLIATFETEQTLLNSQIIEQLVQKYLL